MKAKGIRRILPLINSSAIQFGTYEEGQVLFHEGKRAPFVFFVEIGEVRAERYLISGQTLVLFRAPAETLLGETCLYSSLQAFTAVASRPTRVLKIGKEAFRDALNADTTHWETLYNCLAHRLIDGLKMREILAIRKADDRLLNWLKWKESASPEGLDLGNRLGSIGLELNLTRESIYRAFARLKEDGLVEVNDGIVRLREDA